MKIDFVGTYAFNRNLQLGAVGLQRELSKAQVELATGQVSDIGATLGHQTSRAVNLDAQVDLLDQIKSLNGVYSNRLSSMQSAMGAMVEASEDFMGEMGAAIGGNLDPEVLKGMGGKLLSTANQFINTTFNGEFVFSGVNTDVNSLVNMDSDEGDAARLALEQAFQTHFGFASDDPAGLSITSSDMQDFLDGPFQDLFDDSNWNTLWSGASDRGMRSRISPREIVENPVTANDEGFRKVVAAGALVDFLAVSGIGGDALQATTEHALKLAANGVSDLANAQGRLGVVEQRLSDAEERLSVQKNLLSEQLGSMVGVDQYEIATRINQLVINLEASYSASSRIQSLSLMNYL